MLHSLLYSFVRGAEYLTRDSKTAKFLSLSSLNILEVGWDSLVEIYGGELCYKRY